MIIERVKASLNARLQAYQSMNYEKTHYGKQLAAFKDIHKGEKCFIIGNGPSLKAEDLQKLHEAGIVTFASNRIYNIFEQTQWRPTYFVSEDEDVLGPIQKEASAVPAKAKFIPVNLKWYKDINIDNAIYFYMDYNGEYKDSFGISLNVPHAIRCRATVTTTCIQLALHMGFSKIYLLGVDHSYSKVVNSNGEVIEDKTIKDYFSDNYDNDFKNTIVRNLDDTTKAYLDIELLSRKMKSFRVYNSTRGGKLEAFERIDFDSLF